MSENKYDYWGVLDRVYIGLIICSVRVFMRLCVCLGGRRGREMLLVGGVVGPCGWVGPCRMRWGVGRVYSVCESAGAFIVASPVARVCFDRWF